MAETQTTLETINDDAEPKGPPPLYALRVTGGADSGKSLVLDWNAMPTVRIGKSRTCELELGDPRVSRRHLSLEPRGHAVRVRDLDTTNGTCIGGVRVVDALLTGGETIEIGQTTIRIVRAGTSASSPDVPRESFGRLVGRSEAMQRVFALAERLAASPLPILIEGETGTGKALLAEAIHEVTAAGPRPFQVVAASASVDAMLDAVDRAAGGTLVIDEASDLSDAAQARLVPVLDGRGGNVRVLATTRRDLERQVQDGGFREELLFRLSGAHVELPPLRARRGDVALLARHFWAAFGGQGAIPKSFLVQLERHDWPGNVRELENAVARRIALGDALEGATFVPPAGHPDFLEHVLALGLAMPSARQLVMEEFEQRFVERAIAAHGGNVSRAAAASGVTRRYFHIIRSKRAHK